jgi:hypothetical protein
MAAISGGSVSDLIGYYRGSSVDLSDGDDEGELVRHVSTEETAVRRLLYFTERRSSFASPSRFSLRGRRPTVTSGHRNVPVSTTTTLQCSLHLVRVPDTGSQHTARKS